MGWHVWYPMLLPVAYLLRLAARRPSMRRGRPQLPPPRTHKPDYAKIRQLESELGIGEPVPDNAASIFGGLLPSAEYPPASFGPFVSPAKPETSPAGITYRPLSSGPVSSWAYCPVCTRTHEGRCAG